MANETIELLKNYDPAKMQWPAMHQQKIDGVPVRIIRQNGEVRSYTRQGERVLSINHIERFCVPLLRDGESVVMELHVAGMPFKQVSGLVRRKAQSPELIGWIWDADLPWLGEASWHGRQKQIALRLIDLARIAGVPATTLLCRCIPGSIVADAEEAEAAHEALMLANPEAEGSVLHSLRKTFQPGKRCWGTQRMKPVPTIDLKIVGFEEAISETGLPLGMVGRLNAEYNYMQDNTKGQDPAMAVGVHMVKTVIGIGPGALTHAERKKLWALFNSGNYKPCIAEIRYMRDETYDALRQPTFKHWRKDKVTPDV